MPVASLPVWRTPFFPSNDNGRPRGSLSESNDSPGVKLPGDVAEQTLQGPWSVLNSHTFHFPKWSQGCFAQKHKLRAPLPMAKGELRIDAQSSRE